MPVHDPRFTESHRQSLLEAARAQGDAIARAEWQKAFALLGVGAIGTFLVIAVGYGPEVAAGLAFVYPVMLAAEVALGIVALYLASIIVGDLGTLPLAFARLAGILAITDLAVVLLFGSLGCWGVALTLTLYVFLFMWLFDLERVDAVIVMIMTVIAKMAALFGMAMAVEAMFG